MRPLQFFHKYETHHRQELPNNLVLLISVNLRVNNLRAEREFYS